MNKEIESTTTEREAVDPASALLGHADTKQVIEEGWQKFKAADDYNRLRLGDAATEMLEICHMIEGLPASRLQSDISLKASDLRRRMAEQAKWPNASGQVVAKGKS